MKKITLLTAFMVAAFTNAQTYTENFESVGIGAAPQNDGAEYGLTQTQLNLVAAGDGEWFSVVTGGQKDFGVVDEANGSDGKYVSRVSQTQYARGLAYVYNNSDNSVTGSYTLSFDYFFDESFANEANERFGYHIWGVSGDLVNDPDNAVIDYFKLTSGNGNFGDNNATNFTDGSFTLTVDDLTGGHIHLPTSNSWTGSGDIVVDFGAADTYKYIVVVFGQVWGGDGSTDHTAKWGLDDVILPTQSNPQVLSTENVAKQAFSVFPNPTAEFLNIKNLNGAYSYRISDVTGKLLLSDNNRTFSQINVNSLNKGLYLLEIIDENNTKSVSKFVKN